MSPAKAAPGSVGWSNTTIDRPAAPASPCGPWAPVLPAAPAAPSWPACPSAPVAPVPPALPADPVAPPGPIRETHCPFGNLSFTSGIVLRSYPHVPRDRFCGRCCLSEYRPLRKRKGFHPDIAWKRGCRFDALLENNSLAGCRSRDDRRRDRGGGRLLRRQQQFVFVVGHGV